MDVDVTRTGEFWSGSEQTVVETLLEESFLQLRHKPVLSSRKVPHWLVQFQDPRPQFLCYNVYMSIEGLDYLYNSTVWKIKQTLSPLYLQRTISVTLGRCQGPNHLSLLWTKFLMSSDSQKETSLNTSSREGNRVPIDLYPLLFDSIVLRRHLELGDTA